MKLFQKERSDWENSLGNDSNAICWCALHFVHFFYGGVASVAGIRWGFLFVVCVVCSCLVFGFGFFPECDVSFMVAESTLSLNRSATVVRRSTFFRKANAAATKSAVYQVKTI